MGNFYVKYAIQLVENVFQNSVQEKWHQFFGTDFNLLHIHAKLLDDGTGTCFLPRCCRIRVLSVIEGQGE